MFDERIEKDFYINDFEQVMQTELLRCAIVIDPRKIEKTSIKL